MKRRRLFQAFAVLMVAVCLLILPGLLSAQGNSDNGFERVKEVQERHTKELMAKEGVVGTGVGLNERGQHAVVVLLETAIGGIPQELEGVPVYPILTGKMYALPKGGNHGGRDPKPTAAWPRPVPIGVSTGNVGECSAGTISCRVKDASHVYALSNNHVYALENTAPIGSEVVQPGLYDTRCVYNPGNVIGTLAAFEPIDFSTTASNTIDAAIAISTAGDLGNSTPTDGYGTPNSTTATAAIGMAVQKYGRTTSLTSGTVTLLNVAVTVTYSSGTAQFVNQIIVQTKSPFIKAGDSGSLMVTNDTNCYPVGLLFAGNNSGNYAIANPIDLVLSAFNVTVDGK